MSISLIFIISVIVLTLYVIGGFLGMLVVNYFLKKANRIPKSPSFYDFLMILSFWFWPLSIPLALYYYYLYWSLKDI